MEKIKVTSVGYDLSEIAQELEIEFPEYNLKIEIINKPVRNDIFSMSPEIASIIVSGLSVFSLLINALLVYISSRKSGTIVIVGSSGRKIEIPKDTPKEKVNEFIALAQKIDSIDHLEVNSW